MFSEFCLSSLLICITGDRPTGLCIAFHDHFRLICTVGINAVREVMVDVM